MNKIVEIEWKINSHNFIYKIGNKKKDKTNYFQKFETIRPFWREMYHDKLSLDDVFEQQISLEDKISVF